MRLELEGPGKRLLSDALVAVDNAARQLGNAVHEHERVHVIAAEVGHGKVAVSIVDTIGQSQQE